MVNKLDDQYAAIDGSIGWLEIATAFYADDGILTSREGQSLQRSFDLWTHYFEGCILRQILQRQIRWQFYLIH
jgi:hypothetical protein